jgi:hypothetical protein
MTQQGMAQGRKLSNATHIMVLASHAREAHGSFAVMGMFVGQKHRLIVETCCISTSLWQCSETELTTGDHDDDVHATHNNCRFIVPSPIPLQNNLPELAIMSIPMALRSPIRAARRLPLWTSRSFASRPPPFPVVPSCPSPTCACASTPAMPEGMEIDHQGNLNGVISGYAEQVLVCTGREDWTSRIEDECDGDNLAADLKELFGRGGRYSDVSSCASLIFERIQPRVRMN